MEISKKIFNDQLERVIEARNSPIESAYMKSMDTLILCTEPKYKEQLDDWRKRHQIKDDITGYDEILSMIMKTYVCNTHTGPLEE